MKLLFQASNGKERVIADVSSWCDACNGINKFLDEHNFKSYYQRLWQENNRVYVDVGSHTEFFIVEPCTMDIIHIEQEMLDKD